MHHLIKHHTHTKQSSGIKYIEIPIDTIIPWNSIPSSPPEYKWKRITNPKTLKDFVSLKIKITSLRHKEHHLLSPPIVLQILEIHFYLEV